MLKQWTLAGAGRLHTWCVGTTPGESCCPGSSRRIIPTAGCGRCRAAEWSGASPRRSAALRELAEETGLTATLGPVVGVFSRWFTDQESVAGESGHVVGIVFGATDIKGELRTLSRQVPPTAPSGSNSNRSSTYLTSNSLTS